MEESIDIEFSTDSYTEESSIKVKSDKPLKNMQFNKKAIRESEYNYSSKPPKTYTEGNRKQVNKQALTHYSCSNDMMSEEKVASSDNSMTLFQKLMKSSETFQQDPINCHAGQQYSVGSKNKHTRMTPSVERLKKSEISSIKGAFMSMNQTQLPGSMTDAKNHTQTMPMDMNQANSIYNFEQKKKQLKGLDISDSKKLKINDDFVYNDNDEFDDYEHLPTPPVTKTKQSFFATPEMPQLNVSQRSSNHSNHSNQKQQQDPYFSIPQMPNRPTSPINNRKQNYFNQFKGPEFHNPDYSGNKHQHNPYDYSSRPIPPPPPLHEYPNHYPPMVTYYNLIPLELQPTI